MRNHVSHFFTGLVLSLTGMFFFAPTSASAPECAPRCDVTSGHQFAQDATLDITQVETEEEREASCDLWYFEESDLLACK